MRLTIRTNLALRTLMMCAVNEGQTLRKHEIAEACNVSENHLAQVINTLGQLDFVETVRGRRGGLRLARRMDQINVGDVFRAFEASVPFAECFEPQANTCPLVDVCILRNALSAAIEAFYATLDRLTLRDLVKDNTGLKRILAIRPEMPRFALSCP
ncbi:MAG: Rrf2 family transcriptional regulator [Paracoccaceae bacterium]|nr:Rrf2 family transcriptional regulator [Paracoccaceae bacterium]MDE3240958.1 Rrf2 family transcriptional regulator [Paracoccaceae bacterium]